MVEKPNQQEVESNKLESVLDKQVMSPINWDKYMEQKDEIKLAEKRDDYNELDSDLVMEIQSLDWNDRSYKIRENFDKYENDQNKQIQLLGLIADDIQSLDFEYFLRKVSKMPNSDKLISDLIVVWKTNIEKQYSSLILAAELTKNDPKLQLQVCIMWINIIISDNTTFYSLFSDENILDPEVRISLLRKIKFDDIERLSLKLDILKNEREQRAIITSNSELVFSSSSNFSSIFSRIEWNENFQQMLFDSSEYEKLLVNDEKIFEDVFSWVLYWKNLKLTQKVLILGTEMLKSNQKLFFKIIWFFNEDIGITWQGIILKSVLKIWANIILSSIENLTKTIELISANNDACESLVDIIEKSNIKLKFNLLNTTTYSRAIEASKGNKRLQDKIKLMKTII